MSIKSGIFLTFLYLFVAFSTRLMQPRSEILVAVKKTLLTLESILRSKRFRRAFRPLEAFFAFWLRKNWGERNTDGSSEKCIERAESLTETLATQAISNQASVCLSRVGKWLSHRESAGVFLRSHKAYLLLIKTTDHRNAIKTAM